MNDPLLKNKRKAAHAALLGTGNPTVFWVGSIGRSHKEEKWKNKKRGWETSAKGIIPFLRYVVWTRHFSVHRVVLFFPCLSWMCWHPPHSLSTSSQARSMLLPCGKTQKTQPTSTAPWLCFVQIHRFVGLKTWKLSRINHKQCYCCTTVLTKLNLVIARYWSDWSNLS